MAAIKQTNGSVILGFYRDYVNFPVEACETISCNSQLLDKVLTELEPLKELISAEKFSHVGRVFAPSAHSWPNSEMQAVKLLQADDYKLRARIAELEDTVKGALFAVPKIAINKEECSLVCIDASPTQLVPLPEGNWSLQPLTRIVVSEPHEGGVLLKGKARCLTRPVVSEPQQVGVQLNGAARFLSLVYKQGCFRFCLGARQIRCNLWLLNKLLDELEPITDGQSEANCQVWAEFKAAARGLF